MNQRIINSWFLTSLAFLASILTGEQTANSGTEDKVKATEHVDRTLAFPAGGTLQLHNFSGDVHITGTTGKDLVIKAVRRARRDQLEHIVLDIQTSGSTVTIDANKRDPSWQYHSKDNVVETSFEVEVPADAKLEVEAFSSNLDIRALAGTQRLKTFSGDISVDAAVADAAPILTAETFSGGIRVRLADSAKGDVSFESFSGSFHTELPLTLHPASHNRASGALPGAASDGTLRFKTFSGDVHVTK